MKKPLDSSSRRSNRTTCGVGATAAAAAAVVTAALTAVTGNAVAGSDLRAGVPDVADRVVALRRLLAEKPASDEGATGRVDPLLSPGTPIAQWNKWKNG